MARTKNADSDTTKTIRDLAGEPGSVRLTSRAYWDLLSEHITKAEVCSTICRWIDAGKPINVITTTKVPEYMGEPAYVLKPLLKGKEFYVKVVIDKPGELKEALLIVSAHKSGH